MLSTIIIAILVVLTIIRCIINIKIFRVEYDYHEYTDGVAISFEKKEVEKRDNNVSLFVLSLFTLFWYRYKKVANRQKVIMSNVISAIFFMFLLLLAYMD